MSDWRDPMTFDGGFEHPELAGQVRTAISRLYHSAGLAAMALASLARGDLREAEAGLKAAYSTPGMSGYLDLEEALNAVARIRYAQEEPGDPEAEQGSLGLGEAIHA